MPLAGSWKLEQSQRRLLVAGAVAEDRDPEIVGEKAWHVHTKHADPLCWSPCCLVGLRELLPARHATPGVSPYPSPTNCLNGLLPTTIASPQPYHGMPCQRPTRFQINYTRAWMAQGHRGDGGAFRLSRDFGCKTQTQKSGTRIDQTKQHKVLITSLSSCSSSDRGMLPPSASDGAIRAVLSQSMVTNMQS